MAKRKYVSADGSGFAPLWNEWHVRHPEPAGGVRKDGKQYTADKVYPKQKEVNPYSSGAASRLGGKATHDLRADLAWARQAKRLRERGW
jgi:hypothetical protein